MQIRFQVMRKRMMNLSSSWKDSRTASNAKDVYQGKNNTPAGS